MKPMSLQQERALFYGAIAEMQGRPNSAYNVPGRALVNSSGLSKGDSGSAVAALQLYLMEQGCGSDMCWSSNAAANDEADRKYFGEETESALGKYQAYEGLAVSHWVDSSTWANIKEECATGASWDKAACGKLGVPWGEDDKGEKGEKALGILDKIFGWGKKILVEVAPLTGPRKEESKDTKKDEKDDNGFPWGTVALVGGIVVVVGGGAWFAASRVQAAKAARRDDE